MKTNASQSRTRMAKLACRIAAVFGLCWISGGTGFAQVYEKVYDFASELRPSGSVLDTYISDDVLLGFDGCLYGVTQGSSDDSGSIFKVTTEGVVTTLLYLPSADQDDIEVVRRYGCGPRGGLARAGDLNYYGTTTMGGEFDGGTIFRITPAGEFTKLHDFNGTDGGYCAAPMLAGMDGALYGVTRAGGSFDCGVLFKLTLEGDYTVLHHFTGTGGPVRGAHPSARLVQTPDGSFYGVTGAGGVHDCGTIFKLEPGGGFSTVVDFTGETGDCKGSGPLARLAFAPDGRLYGTTVEGGQFGLGTIFWLSLSGDFETLVEFSGDGGANPGGYPWGGLLPRPDGTFYGTETYGGEERAGTVFKMNAQGEVLFQRDVLPFQGETPLSLVDGGDGNFYGVGYDGDAGPGSIFRFTPDGVGTLLAAASYGGRPSVGETKTLIDGGDGYFYGTTSLGGSDEAGTIFRLSKSGKYSILAEFTDDNDAPNRGQEPNSLVRGLDGNFYGTASGGGVDGRGLVFRMTPQGVLSPVYEFSSANGSPGLSPNSLIVGPQGELYGTTRYAEGNLAGTIFKVTPSGAFQHLASFTGNGETFPGDQLNRLLFASDGNFYGSTKKGGDHGHGTVFRMTPAGAVAVIHHLNGNPSVRVSGVSWQNFKIEPQTGLFDIYFSVQPQANGMDGVTGLSFGNADAYHDLACVVRLNSQGNFDVRRGNTYGSDMSFPYVSGLTYRVKMTVDLQQKRYSVAVNDVVIATNYAFRSEQAGVAKLDRLALRNESGAHVVSGVSLELLSSRPGAALVEGGDGYLYGTTSAGEAGWEPGTFFRISHGGAFQVLNSLGSIGGGDSIGQIYPQEDGSFLGTSGSPGGAFHEGLVFRATKVGDLFKVVDFPSYDVGDPADPLVLAPDGTLYGLAYGRSGSIYRVMFPGKPAIYDSLELPETATDAFSFQADFSARGSLTAVYVDYVANDWPVPPGGDFSHSLAIGGLDGFLSTRLGTTLLGLERGKFYFYRFRATNVHGTTLGPILSFATSGPPRVSLSEATNVGATGAVLNGTVNAANASTSAVFHYGETPAAVGHVTVPIMVEGAFDQTVSVPLTGLEAGTTYYYRLVATNALGTVTQGTGSFTTIAAPLVAITGAGALSTTKARISGTVNSRGGSITSIRVFYGLLGEGFPKSVSISPLPAPGQVDVPVTATLTGLIQDQTYEYFIRVVGSGGSKDSSTGNFHLSLLSGLLFNYPDPPPPTEGTVTVNLLPAGIGAGWRFAGEEEWRPSGESASHLAAEDRVIEFRAVPGYLAPPDELMPLDGSAQVMERRYYSTTAAGSGELRVHLEPQVLADSPTLEQRLQWSLQVPGKDEWRDSDVSLDELTAGTYLVTFKPVSGRDTPPPASVVIAPGELREFTITYFKANSPVGAGPVPRSMEEITAEESLPFAYTGQLRGNRGSGTGFVVKRRVVATAAHVVFDEDEQVFTAGLQWLPQRHAGAYEPAPIEPRGYYVHGSYSSQLQQETTPGESSEFLQHLDYAALYFRGQEAARGGFGGYLASEAEDENEFLDSSAEKILAGYAIDGVAPGDRGKLHATPAFTVPLTPAFGETWTTMAIHGTGGCSGGPLFVKHSNGKYYPAAIYLGGSGQTVVRAIDAHVVDLFLRAEASGDGGGNNTSGGIVHTGVTPSGAGSNYGSLSVVIQPASVAALSQARWWLEGAPDLIYTGGTTKNRLTPGSYLLRFGAVPGYKLPVTATAVVTKEHQTTITFTYEPQSPLELWRQNHFGTVLNQGEAADGADPDHDGWSNFDEYTAGTDPSNAVDVLRVLSAQRAGSVFAVTAAGKAGRFYVLERRSLAGSGSWLNVDLEGPLPANASLLLTDPSPPPGEGFYRVKVTLPE